MLQLRGVGLKAKIVLLPQHVRARRQQKDALAFELQGLINVGEGAAEAFAVVALDLGPRPQVQLVCSRIFDAVVGEDAALGRRQRDA